MKFRVTKIAAAVATGLGVSVVGMNVAQADALMFPYFAVGGAVTTIFSVINTAPPVNTTVDQLLHYRFYYKNNNTAGGVDSLTSSCNEFDVRRITSPNDIVTFDAGGHFGADTKGILFEPTSRQFNAAYKPNDTFALMGSLAPARGVMIVSNESVPASLNENSYEGSLFGEALVMDFGSGSAWGYTAYNASPAVNTDDVSTAPARTPLNAATTPALAYDFSDRNENAGEVLAGSPVTGGASPPVPVAVMPVAGYAADPSQAVTTAFFVTPIAHNAIVYANPASANSSGLPWQVSPRTDASLGYQLYQDIVQTQIGLTVVPWSGNALDVVYDRDETPVSGQQPQTVRCVGKVLVDTMVSEGVKREWGAYGGWSAVSVQAPGALTTATGFNDITVTGVPSRFVGGVINSNQAIVQKLEYNSAGTFYGSTFAGSYNSALWLHTPGIARESLVVTTNGACVTPNAGGRCLASSAATSTTGQRYLQQSYSRIVNGFASVQDAGGGVPSGTVIPYSEPSNAQ